MKKRWLAMLLLSCATASAHSASAQPNQALARMALSEHHWGEAVTKQATAWYAMPGARAIADNLIGWQSREGGFPKNTDLTKAPSAADLAENEAEGRANTFDNGGTTLPLEYLALMVNATGDARYRAAFQRGFDYTLAAQYKSGGWPQFYPLRKGYYSHITFNDDAMTRVIVFLRRVGRGETPFDFVSTTDRQRAASAAERGLALTLKLQIVQSGKPTIWAAQYDEDTLQPAWARRYEPPSLSGSESVAIVRLLMSVEQPTPAIISAVEGAVAWMKAHAVTGQRYERFIDAHGAKDARVVSDPAAPPIWARFYELGTNRPIFLGRDSVVRYAFAEIEQERRGGYGYYGDWPRDLLSRDYPAWQRRIGR